MNTSDLHGHTTNTTSSSTGGTATSTTTASAAQGTSSSSYGGPTKPGLLSNSSSGGSVGLSATAMANYRFDFVILSKLDKDGNLNLLHTKPLSVEILNQVPDSVILFSEDKKNPLFKYTIGRDVEYARLGANKVIVNTNTESISIQFSKDSEKNEFISKLADIRNGKRHSLFDQRTDETSAVQYFQFYSLLSQQQNMMQDYVRTATYQKAIFDNSVDFEGKVVLDVGAGSGILSFFAAQAGAAKVYAVEASSMAQHASALVKHNNMQGKIKIVSGKIEDIELPEKVDVIISEPMGYALLNERMLESFLFAKKWLKPNGKMFPTLGDLYVAPFTDEALYMEQAAKANFWSQNSFYGIDLTVLKPLAFDEYFKQPVVDTFDPRIILASPVKHSINFLSSAESDLYNIEVPLKYDVQAASIVHGLAFWFDVAFNGSTVQTWLSTSPTQPLTHWYQVRCLFPQPFLVTRTAQLVGKVQLKSNKKQSYDVNIMLTVEGSSQVFTNTLDLKNPYFRYNGQVSVPAGHYHESPTEYYLNTIAAMTSQHAASYHQQQQHPHQYHQQPSSGVSSSSQQSGSGQSSSTSSSSTSSSQPGGSGGHSTSSTLSGVGSVQQTNGSQSSSSSNGGQTVYGSSSSSCGSHPHSHSSIHSSSSHPASHSHAPQPHPPVSSSLQSKESKHPSEP